MGAGDASPGGGATSLSPRERWRVDAERHYALVHRVAARVAGSVDAGAEIAQEVFLRYFRALDRGLEIRDPAGWLVRVALRFSWRHVRTRRLRIWRPLDPEAWPSPEREPPAGIESRETVLRLRRAVERLPSRQRSAIVLRELEGMETESVAERMGCSVGTVRVLLFQARRRLQGILRDEGSGRV